MDWEVFPQGLTALLVRLHRDYAPAATYVTENGCAYEDHIAPDGQILDDKRVAYYRSHPAACRRAIAMGVPLEGYFAWSLLDNL